jgi:hypothetical protein
VQGPVRATLTFTRTDTRHTYADADGRETSYVQSTYARFRVTIEREGRVVLSRRLAPICRACVAPGTGGKAIRLARLDAGNDPYGLVDLYTGGAHCCWISIVLPTTGGAARPLVHDWGDPSYRLKDLDGDGVPEFLTADDHFAYAFTSFAGSGFPIQVRRLEGGRLKDVTREFPALVRADARQWLAFYRRERKRPQAEVRGFLAAYVADEYLLGTPDAGWAVVDEAVRKGELDAPGSTGAAYARQLSHMLDSLGYAPGSGARP